MANREFQRVDGNEDLGKLLLLSMVVAFFFFLENWAKGIEFEGNGGEPRNYSEEAWGEMPKSLGM